MSAGQLFITRGDLTRLCCDAWLLPADAAAHVAREGWVAHDEVLASLRGPDGRMGIELPAEWRRDELRTLQVHPGGERQGAPWLTSTGRRAVEPSWYGDGVEQFIRAAAATVEVPRYGRVKPLLGVPLVGTGYGGARTFRGDVVEVLVERLAALVAECEVDVALVLADDRSHAAAQYARRHLVENGAQDAAARLWCLSDVELAAADQLAAHAQRGRLVLFLGAGVSIAAGLPGWEALLRALAEEAGFSPDECDALERLDVLDRARLVADRFAAAGGSVGSAVQTRLESDQYSIVHALLASLPVGEIVTTNYDLLFERASEDCGRRPAVLPDEPARDAERWLLKLHGTISHPEDIGLTREDYLRFSASRAALAGIVQALLITRHMLFVGFSLDDDNFHRIVDDVRRALRGPGAVGEVEHFGTSLHLVSDPMLERLWLGDLEMRSFSEPSAEGTIPSAEAARQLEVFLDRVLFSATNNRAHLLDDAFDGVLDGDERRVRELLVQLQREGAELARSDAWQPVAEILERYGVASPRHGNQVP